MFITNSAKWNITPFPFKGSVWWKRLKIVRRPKPNYMRSIVYPACQSMIIRTVSCACPCAAPHFKWIYTYYPIRVTWSEPSEPLKNAHPNIKANKKWIWITVSHSRIYRHTLSHSWNDWNRVNSYGANSRTKKNYNGNARLKVGLCCLPAFPNTYTVHKHNLRRSHWSSVIRFLPLFFGHVCPFVLRLWR